MFSVVWLIIVGKLYLDNELIINTGKFGGLNARNIKPSDTVKKTVQEGVHRIKVDLLNIPIKEKVKPVIKNLLLKLGSDCSCTI